MNGSAPSFATDANLLFGILDLQMDFISGEALIAAMNTWVLAKTKSLGQVLAEQAALTSERQAKVEALVRERMQAQQVTPDPVDPEATELAPPVPPPRYHVLREHREGGLGKVYVAHDEELNREVALKRLKERHADHPQSRARFVLEAEVTGGLEHPGIAPVYGLGKYPDGRPFYAMRFIRGDSLQAAITAFHRAEAPGRDPGQRALALRDLLNRFISVCNAVAYAHSRGVLHRDLKPANVMLGPYGETLVVDWGLAKLLHDEEIPTAEGGPGPLRPASLTEGTPTQIGARIGTSAYMAPEQADGRLDQIDTRTDIYLLGGILFEILTGRPPHPGGVRSTSPPLARSVNPMAPPALEVIAARAMSTAPSDRYATASELAQEVQRWLADEPIVAYRLVVAQLEDLAHRHPEVASYREQLARNRVNLGLVLSGMERHADSERAFREAIADYETLAAASPAIARYRADLGTTRVHLSRALAALNRPEEAEQTRQTAIADFDRLMATNPHDYQTNLASVMITLMPGAEQPPPQPEEEAFRTRDGAAPPEAAAGHTDVSTAADHPEDVPSSGPEPPFDMNAEARARFSLTHQVASGGARIWAARDNDLNRVVAIKELVPFRIDEIRQRFLQEAQITAQLEHPNIIPVYGLGFRSPGDVPFLIMRLAGGNLSQAIKAYHSRQSSQEFNTPQMRRMLSVFVGACRGHRLRPFPGSRAS
jgi:serine/threonine-protein kinase